MSLMNLTLFVPNVFVVSKRTKISSLVIVTTVVRLPTTKKDVSLLLYMCLTFLVLYRLLHTESTF